MRKSGTRSRGFTLIEILLATSLLVLVISFVVLNVEGMVPTYRMEGAARELGATVADVQSQAVISGKIHGIVYDITGGRYWILAPPEEKEEEEEEERDDEEAVDQTKRLVPLKPFSLHQGIDFKDVSLGGRRKKLNGRVKIYFQPDGPGMPHAVHLMDREGREYTIEVNPFTGSIEFFEGYKEFDLFLEVDD
ncbi:MAG: pilus assembly FimT family protein [Planctomycetota bacterium]|jgi:prepilin-type N-terminal cleavage/methylation domain-containing protein